MGKLARAEQLPLRSHGSTRHPRLVAGPLPPAKSGWPPWLRPLWELVYEKMHGKSVAFCLLFFLLWMSLKKRTRTLCRGRNPRKWWISSEFRMSVLMVSTCGGRKVSGHCQVRENMVGNQVSTVDIIPDGRRKCKARMHLPFCCRLTNCLLHGNIMAARGAVTKR